jgi:hypothetical protein
MVQASGPGRADIHTRAPANRLQALQDRDVLGVVSRLCAFTSVSSCAVRQ